MKLTPYSSLGIYKTGKLLSSANLSSRANVATKEMNDLLQAGNASNKGGFTAVGHCKNMEVELYQQIILKS